MKIEAKEIKDKREWEGFLAQRQEANFLQSWNWGQFYLNLGQKVFYRGYFQDKKLLGVALLIEERAKRAKYLILPGGPILDWENSELIKAWYSDIWQVAKREKVVFIRCRPQLQDEPKWRQLWQDELNFVDSPMHLQAELTHQLDLTQSEDQLLKNMRKATRYEIKKAQKEKIVIEQSQESTEIENFYQLQLETAKRQKFIPFSLDFWQKQFEALNQDKQVILYTAKWENQLLAQAMIIFYGQEAVYHYGASTELARKHPGACLIQWTAIQEAKKRGLSRYNFWGVAPENEKDHRFAKLSVFKRGFGGVDWQYLHAQDLVIDQLRYLANLLVEKVRKIVRKV